MELLTPHVHSWRITYKVLFYDLMWERMAAQLSGAVRTVSLIMNGMHQLSSKLETEAMHRPNGDKKQKEIAKKKTTTQAEPSR